MKLKYYLYLTVPLSLLSEQQANAFSQQSSLFEERAEVLRDFPNWQQNSKSSSSSFPSKQTLNIYEYLKTEPSKKPPVIDVLSTTLPLTKSFNFLLQEDTQKEKNISSPVKAPIQEKEEKLGWGQWLYQGIKEGVKNVLQKPFGERMQPSQLKNELASVERLSAAGGWTGSKTTYCPGFNEDKPVFQHTTSPNGKKVIVSAPAHDMDESLRNTMDWAMNGNMSVKEVIQAVEAENPQGDFKLLMPVAQANTYFGFFTRRHWTTLEVERKDGKYNATHYDSKGILSSVYSLDHVKKQLPANTEFSHIYTGQQGLFNDKDCGRFTISYINHRLQDKDPRTTEVSSITSIFSSLWRK